MLPSTHQGPLVSIIIPCYNGEKNIHRLFDSILQQTYKKLEVIIVNDGSKDKTESVVLSYKSRFENSGIIFIYLTQENKGVGHAINYGLSRVTGQYLCWPDHDDYYEPDSIEERLKILEQKPEFDIVASDAYLRSINNLSEPLGLISSFYKKNEDPDQFIHLLQGRSFICSGCYMVRTKVFFGTHSEGKIYPSRGGQNYQILLPIYLKTKRYFLNKPLYNYVKYESSHSRIDDNSLKETIERNNRHKDIIINTVANLSVDNDIRNSYYHLVNVRFASLNFRAAYTLRDFNLVKQEYDTLRHLKHLSWKVRLKYLFAKCFGIF